MAGLQKLVSPYVFEGNTVHRRAKYIELFYSSYALLFCVDSAFCFAPIRAVRMDNPSI